MSNLALDIEYFNFIERNFQSFANAYSIYLIIYSSLKSSWNL